MFKGLLIYYLFIWKVEQGCGGVLEEGEEERERQREESNVFHSLVYSPNDDNSQC